MSKGKGIRKRLIACAIALLLLAGLSGCGIGGSEKELPEQTENLVLYADPYLAKFLDVAVYRFSLVYPDVKVEVRDFGDMNDPQSEQNYMDVLTTELAAGEGPDLILFKSYDFGDLQKTAQSGTFQDISGYIESDPDFNMDNYNSAVMETGVFDGQRLFVPLGYSVDVILTTEEVLAGANQQLPTTFQDWCEQIADFGQTYRDDTNRYFTQDYYLYHNLLQSSGLSLVDYTSKEVTIDNADFRSFMEAYKELYEIDWVRSEKGIYVSDPNVGANTTELLENGKILYVHEMYQLGFGSDYSDIMKYTDQALVYTAFPSVTGKPVATINMCAAVNSNGENKANAYNLLKTMLSEVVQNYGCESFNAFAYFDIPVLNGALTNCMEYLNDRYGAFFVPDDTIADYASLASDVTCSYVSWQIEGFIWDEMQPYFEGRKSYEECLASLVNKLELYINE